MGKITWYPGGCHAADLRVRPSQRIVRPDKVRVAHDWPNPAYGLHGLPVNLPVGYGGMDGFLSLSPPGTYVAGLDFQGWFRHWLASPAYHRFLGVRPR